MRIKRHALEANASNAANAANAVISITPHCFGAEANGNP